jgi:uncharacterized integral membrane protein
MAEAPPQPKPAPKSKSRWSVSPARRERIRLIGALLLGALIAVFAVTNLDPVEVNWLFGTWSTPLIIVIGVSAAIGAALDRVVQHRAGRKR